MRDLINDIGLAFHELITEDYLGIIAFIIIMSW